jgi:hypothetical protein
MASTNNVSSTSSTTQRGELSGVGSAMGEASTPELCGSHGTDFSVGARAADDVDPSIGGGRFFTNSRRPSVLRSAEGTK